MSAHVVLLFASVRASKHNEPSINASLEKAGYEVVEAHSLSTASALLFVSRKVEAVVVDSDNGSVAAEVADSLNAIRPGLPLLLVPGGESQSRATERVGDDRERVISTLEELLGRCAG
jgi:DNA-binding NtrC family response regulator